MTFEYYIVSNSVFLKTAKQIFQQEQNQS